MRIFQVIFWPFGFVYGLIMLVRNKLFDWNLLSVSKVDLPVISVGNLSVGGTGKTPHVDYIVSYLKEKLSVAILLRGYGRKSRGYILLDENTTIETVGDEALFYKKKHEKQVEVVVCEKRAEGAKKIVSQLPSVDVVVLDDAFQHRYLHRDIDILLVDYNNPYWKDTTLPAGRLREFSVGKKRANIIVITKSPDDLSIEEKQQLTSKVNPTSNQYVFFSKIKYGAVKSLTNNKFKTPDKILLVTGIAQPEPLKKYFERIAPVEHLNFNDHHDFSIADIKKIHELFDTFVDEEKIIITTAKDYMRLSCLDLKKEIDKYPWFYQDIKVEMDDEKKFKELIDKIC